MRFIPELRLQGVAKNFMIMDSGRMGTTGSIRKGDFKFPVEYKPSMEQLVGLVQNSGFCEQTIGKVLIELSDCNDFHVYP